jgi:hypothetical protein
VSGADSLLGALPPGGEGALFLFSALNSVRAENFRENQA